MWTERLWGDFLKEGFALIPGPLALVWECHSLSCPSPDPRLRGTHQTKLKCSRSAVVWPHPMFLTFSMLSPKTWAKLWYSCSPGISGPQNLITPSTHPAALTLSSSLRCLIQKPLGKLWLCALDVRPVLIKTCSEGEHTVHFEDLVQK